MALMDAETRQVVLMLVQGLRLQDQMVADLHASIETLEDMMRDAGIPVLQREPWEPSPVGSMLTALLVQLGITEPPPFRWKP